MKFLFKLLVFLIVLAGGAVVGAYYLYKKDDVSYAELEQRYATQPSKFVDLPSGIRVHFRDQGNPLGRTLVLVHGFAVSLETWEPWVKQLSGDYRMVTLDLPAHGLTRSPPGYVPSVIKYADLVAEFAALIGLDKYTLVGHSMGGHTAWLLALRHPEKLDALVLLDAGGWFDLRAVQDLPPAFRVVNDERLAPYLANLDPRPLLKNGLEAAFVDKSMVTNGMVDRYADLARAPGNRTMLGTLMRSSDPESLATKEKLMAISVPTLILWGDKDAVVPMSDAQKFKEAIPNSSVIIYQNVGHLPQEESAEKSARDLKSFLDGLQPANDGIAPAKGDLSQRS